MLTFLDDGRGMARPCRRAFLRVGPPGLAALAGIGLDPLEARALAAQPAAIRDRSVIFLFMATDPVTIPDLVATVLDAVLDLPRVRLLDGLPREVLEVISRGRPIGAMA